MKTNQDLSTKWKVVIAVLAILAAGLSLWLTIEKLNGSISALAGCGGGSDCANVLGSKWSMVFGVIPVSVFSLILYLGVLASVVMRGELVSWYRQLAAWLVLAAVVWFCVLQIVALESICKYCMTMHAVGFLLAAAILLADFKNRGRFLRQSAALVPCALMLVAALALMQYFGPAPQSHQLEEISLGKVDDEAESSDVHAQGDGRLVKFFDGGKAYRVDALPHIGRPDAEHVLVKYYDYTCDACRGLHENLNGLLEKYPDKICIVLLPAPINQKCNPYLPEGVKDQPMACEFAQLGLAVWQADRTKFAEFHHWLFENNQVPVEAAESMAASLVGDAEFNWENNPWIQSILKQDAADYKEFAQKTPVMPKLLIKKAVMMQGNTRSAKELEQMLQNQLGIR
ncbi:thioredoxin domain-containing protein [Verrucomicrobiaceae bacterium R5-34]|nr:thioredoxin domain-containing protein [Verrucomicrobiaceae bacterium R5-34]